MASAAGITLIPHAYGVTHLHFVLATPGAPMAEYFPLPCWDELPSKEVEPIFMGEPQPENGEVAVSSAPGLGVTVNPKTWKKGRKPIIVSVDLSLTTWSMALMLEVILAWVNITPLGIPVDPDGTASRQPDIVGASRSRVRPSVHEIATRTRTRTSKPPSEHARTHARTHAG